MKYLVTGVVPSRKVHIEVEADDKLSAIKAFYDSIGHTRNTLDPVPDGVTEILPDGSEGNYYHIVAQCEHSGKFIFEGDDYWTDGDGLTFLTSEYDGETTEGHPV